MKNVVRMTFALLLTLSLVMNVNAMTRDELKTKFKKTYTIAGKQVSLRDHEKVLVDEYLTNNNVSSKDCDYIAAKIDEAVAIMNNAGTSDWNKLSRADKNRLKALVTDISNNTAVKATILSGGVLSIKNLDGTEFTRITKDVIKQTSTNNDLVIMTGSMSLVGIALSLWALKKKNA